jgi:hypothetical protein
VSEQSDPQRYLFGRRDHRGLIGGWRTAQVATVVAGLVVAVISLSELSPRTGPLVAGAVVLASVASVSLPLGGRTVDEWVPCVASYLLVLGRGRRQRSDPAALQPRAALVAPGPAAPRAHQAIAAHEAPPSVQLVRRLNGPGVLRSFSLVEVPLNGGRRHFGAVHDAETGDWSAVVAVSGRSSRLADPADLDRRVAAWSSVLATLAGEHRGCARLSWIVRAVPDDGACRAAALEGRPMLRARRDYATLLEETDGRGWRHETLVVVTVAGSRGRLGARGGAPASLEVQVRALEHLLRRSGVAVAGLLSPGLLATAITGAIDTDRARGTRRSGRMPWPISLEEHWGSVRLDDRWQTTYWVAEWPREPIDATFLLPLLDDPSVSAQTTVVLEPVAPARAVKRAEHARTSADADAELRRRHGIALTARHRHEQQVVVQREVELAAGHGAYRYCGLVSVVGSSAQELELAAGRVEQAAALARLELRRLYGVQAAALATSLPLGRGLKWSRR